MAALLLRALQPNLVQSLEGTPALIHGGPFANIAHGCNSVAATKAALRMADYVVRKRASARIWARKNSSTSNAGRLG